MSLDNFGAPGLGAAPGCLGPGPRMIRRVGDGDPERENWTKETGVAPGFGLAGREVRKCSPE